MVNKSYKYKRFKISLAIIIISLMSLTASPNTNARIIQKQRKKGIYNLRNNNLKVSFDKNGMQFIYDYILHKKYNFSHDLFSIIIDGKEIKQNELTRKEIEKIANQLIFTFDSKNYEIKVVYKLKNNWCFISKQLFVTPKKAGKFKIKTVSLDEEQIENPILGEYVIKSRYMKNGTKNYGVFLRFKDHTGMFQLVQNPFLNYRHDGNHYSLSYNPYIEWESSFGAFPSDIACIGTYSLRGQKIPVYMIPEWQWTNGKNPNTKLYEYQSEVNAFTNCVSRFVIDKMPRPLNVQVGWTENDYQIDVSTSSGRDVYKRIINRSVQLGLKYILYQPTNSLLGNFLEASDNWHAEDRLWLGLGIEIRKNEWNPVTDSLPYSIQNMLNYAKSKKIKLIAYVYPILPFRQNKDWLVTVGKGNHKKQYASLGNHKFQDWLIKELSEFKKRTGIGGYSFDYTFFTLPGYSIYAQWWGWRRVMETLRHRFQDILMDGRQAYQDYGPWSWLAGSYPHPTSTDEQPESFIPFPDLHFDRVSADRERYTAYRYRIRDYCPSVLMPGFIGHQTDRYNSKGQHIREPFRLRDWDYLGWKYSLISSIGYAGLNNIVNMIPAKDPEEYRNFPKKDIEFFRDWLEWTKKNRNYLENTEPILGQPAIGKIDGTSAIINNKGFIFLFNPNGRSMSAHFSLDESIGLKTNGQYVLKEIYSEKSKYAGNPNSGFWNYGEKVDIKLDGARAKVLQIVPLNDLKNKIILFGVQGKVKKIGNDLILDNVKGEIGTNKEVLVLLPENEKIQKVNVNGKTVSYHQEGRKILLNLAFAGQAFHHMQEVGKYDSTFKGGLYKAYFMIPGWVFQQLKERKKQYPIPWTPSNYNTPWLVPERLPLFVQIAQPSDTMNVTMKLNGKPVPLTKAYSSVRSYSKDFVGFYVDCSNLKPDKEYHVELSLPELKAGQFQGLFFDNVVTNYTSKLK